MKKLELVSSKADKSEALLKKAPAVQSGAVVSGSGHWTNELPWYKRHSRQSAVLIIATILLVTGAVLGVIRTKQQRARRADAASEFEFQQIVRQADQSLARGGNLAAIATLEGYEPRAATKARQFAVRYRLGNFYQQQQDWPTSLKWYELALATGDPNAGVVLLDIGRLAERIGDNRRAATAYHNYAALLNKQPGSSTKLMARQYEAKARDLGQ